jgi:hypothetical protein
MEVTKWLEPSGKRATNWWQRECAGRNLLTPKSVQKLQMALHAKAKAEPGFRFYALYDKISRDDVLAHAWAQCRSNKGAPGVDGQDFADVEAYGVQRWLGELALALKEESYRRKRTSMPSVLRCVRACKRARAASRSATCGSSSATFATTASGSR